MNDCQCIACEDAIENARIAKLEKALREIATESEHPHGQLSLAWGQLTAIGVIAKEALWEK